MPSYLKVYNAIAGLLWVLVLARLMILYPLVGPEYVSGGLANFVTWVQTLAVLEVLHAALGLVRSSVLTTAMQVASRLLVVWGVVTLFPETAKTSVYSLMVFAWAVTESVRYPYYWYALRGRIPRWLEILRYTTFIPLYPIGASSEAFLIYRALPAAAFWHPWYAQILKAALLIYPPSFYILYMHMWAQRKKVLRKLYEQRLDKKEY